MNILNSEMLSFVYSYLYFVSRHNSSLKMVHCGMSNKIYLNTTVHHFTACTLYNLNMLKMQDELQKKES